MKVSLHSVSYSGTVTPDQASLSLEQFMRRAKTLGYDGVTLGAKRPHALPLDLTAPQRKALRELAEELGLEIVCLAGYNDFADPVDFNRQLNLAYVVDCIELARDLGVPIARTFASGMGEFHQASLAQQIRWVVGAAKEAVRVAEDLGVTLVVQNHSPIGNNIYQLMEVVSAVDSPAYRAAVDCPLLDSSCFDYEEAFRLAGGALAFTTVADYVSTPGPLQRVASGQVLTTLREGVPLGQGSCDYPRFLALLKDAGYDYWINYEMCSRMRGGGSEANLDRIASQSLSYLRSVIGDIYG